MALLIVFLLRLGCGLAAAMAMVSHRDVSSGYFRNHLYVVLGLSVLAALCAWTETTAVLPWAASGAVVAYLGAAAWLYEAPRIGKCALVVTALLLAAGLAAAGAQPSLVSGVTPTLAKLLQTLQTIASAWLLGVVTAAMLLGHWYLNAPGMKLAPLRRLLVYLGAAVAAQSLVVAAGTYFEWQLNPALTEQWMMLAVRWFFGLVGPLALVWMAWQTLAIPNTQSATGILYVAVIGVFTGEVVSQVLSTRTVYPV